MLAGPQGMKLASLRSLILWRLLCTYRRVSWKKYDYCPNMLIHLEFTGIKTLHYYLCGVDLSLDDVQDGDVAVARLPLSSSGHHHVLGLQKPPHHIQHCGFSYTSNLKRRRVTDSTVNIFHSNPQILG